MKHVIVIETVDPDCGGRTISHQTANQIEDAIEDILYEEHGSYFVVRGAYNQKSAIAAAHEMYNAPKWEIAE